MHQSTSNNVQDGLIIYVEKIRVKIYKMEMKIINSWLSILGGHPFDFFIAEMQAFIL